MVRQKYLFFFFSPLNSLSFSKDLGFVVSIHAGSDMGV